MSLLARLFFPSLQIGVILVGAAAEAICTGCGFDGLGDAIGAIWGIGQAGGDIVIEISTEGGATVVTGGGEVAEGTEDAEYAHV
jgi:hypothetical protein